MNIVIVGGGTAGWAAALVIARRHADVHKVTVVESSKIGIIGVGESTTGLFTNIITNQLWDMGCDFDEFITETGATIKYGIKHKGWTSAIDEHYFGPIDASDTGRANPDPYFAYAKSFLDPKDLPRTTRFGNLVLDGQCDLGNDGKWGCQNWAMHVDAQLVGQYFKKIATRSGVKHIDSEIVDVKLDEQGFIHSVHSADGVTVTGDFFIDCTGFKRLLTKSLGNSWISYQKNLPVKAAIPFHLSYQENEVPEPFTTAWAQSSGWMWQIPLLNRKGCGYVFDSDFITPEQAQDEVEKKLGRKIEVQKVIKFNETGRQESAWIKNCVTIGLSSAFLEPLEATSIHTTICQITWLAFEFLKPTSYETLNEGSINLYNNRVRKIFDDTRDFLVTHYMGGRTDSEFWKYINTGETRTEYVDNLIKMCNTKMPGFNDFPDYYGAAGWALYSHVLTGIGRLSKDVCKRSLYDTLPTGNLMNLTEIEFNNFRKEVAEYQKTRVSYKTFIDYYRRKQNEHR